jgi:hypothetical protein
MKILVWFAIGLAGALAFVTTGCREGVKSVAAADRITISASAPPQQQKFCQAILKWNEELARRSQALEKESNPIRKEQMQKQRSGAEYQDEEWKDLFALIGPSGEFTDWRGKVGLPRNLDEPGRYALVFHVCSMLNPIIREMIEVGLGSGKVAWPAKGAQAAGTVDTFIPESSPLGQSLAALSVDKEVTISGTFIWAAPGMQKCCWYRTNEHAHFLPGLSQPYTVIRTPLLMVQFRSITQTR